MFDSILGIIGDIIVILTFPAMLLTVINLIVGPFIEKKIKEKMGIETPEQKEVSKMPRSEIIETEKMNKYKR